VITSGGTGTPVETPRNLTARAVTTANETHVMSFQKYAKSGAGIAFSHAGVVGWVGALGVAGAGSGTGELWELSVSDMISPPWLLMDGVLSLTCSGSGCPNECEFLKMVSEIPTINHVLRPDMVSGVRRID